MVNGRVNKKYFPIIWIGLLIACAVRNAYNIYLAIMASAPTSALSIFWMIVRYALTYAAVPVVIVFHCDFIVWYISASRFVRSVPRNDFCYLVMAAAAVVKFLVGIIEVFSILEPTIATVTTTVLDFTLLTGAMIALFFLMSKWYNFNPVESYNAFKMWFMIYMIVGGILVISSNSVYLSILDGSSFGFAILDMLAYMGEPFPVTE
ncbi:MAG: hypothetical protein K2N18_05730, partial [Clostridia bacterium]|nr:hypothetical protein [Clostridia bacterium]